MTISYFYLSNAPFLITVSSTTSLFIIIILNHYFNSVIQELVKLQIHSTLPKLCLLNSRSKQLCDHQSGFHRHSCTIQRCHCHVKESIIAEENHPPSSWCWCHNSDSFCSCIALVILMWSALHCNPAWKVLQIKRAYLIDAAGCHFG